MDGDYNLGLHFSLSAFQDFLGEKFLKDQLKLHLGEDA